MISVDQLSHTYPRAQAPAIAQLSFQIEPGEIFGFLGPSGAGKSTTQRILTGLLRGYRGAARVLGRDLAAWGRDYYEQIGVVPELPNHFRKLTARENLAYFASLYRSPTRDPRELLAQVDLAGAADTRAEQLSKGMQGRLSLARALLHRPALLFLDEPTSGQDPTHARLVREIIREQQRAGVTIFLTTHDMALAEQLCDRVALLAGGTICALDTPRALRLRLGAPTVAVEYGAAGAPQRREFALAGLADNEEFQGLLRSAALQTIHTREATLEDVFVRLTGRALGEAA